MVHTDNCYREADFLRLDELVKRLIEKMDAFISEMNGSMVSDAIRAEKIKTLERDLNNISASLRATRDDVRTISDWRQRFEGGIKVMLAIPIVCVVITTGIAIYSILSS